MTKLTGAALDRAVANALGLKSVNNCEKWDRPCYKCRSHFCDLSCETLVQPAQETEREALKLATDGLEKILGSFEKDGKVVMKSMIRNELFAEMHLLLKKAKKVLAKPAQEKNT